MDGAGARKPQTMFQTARPDGLTIGFGTPVPSGSCARTKGVLYDLKEAIFLGAHQTGRSTTSLPAKTGSGYLEKLRAAYGLRVGAQRGHGGYYSATLAIIWSEGAQMGDRLQWPRVRYRHYDRRDRQPGVCYRPNLGATTRLGR